MRYSCLFSQTNKTALHDTESVNARLLTQAGFVDQEMAGVYTWLPLGLSVMKNVEQIVREEMNKLGASEIFMPSLQPKEYWDITNRWNNVDILFKIQSQTEKQYALGASHEEVVTPLVQKFVHSYRDLPAVVYQINTKFRDELRAKSGVLRGREFRMKDMYSFHATQEDLTVFYERVLRAYVDVFSRCGLNVKVVQASGGIFTQNPSHEFQAITSAGEDVIVACEKCEFGQNSEVATVQENNACPMCGAKLFKTKGVEVGNIFDLGTKYSDAFDLNFSTEDGQRKRVLMGCYGIGTTRLIGAIVEASHDEKGIIWPKSVAPYPIHLVSLNAKDSVVTDQVYATASALYDECTSAGIEIFWDDRADVSAGEKFADADLIGIPLRLVISERTLRENAVEWKERYLSESKQVSLENIREEVELFIHEPS